jgi:hypothetical protein
MEGKRVAAAAVWCMLVMLSVSGQQQVAGFTGGSVGASAAATLAAGRATQRGSAQSSAWSPAPCPSPRSVPATAPRSASPRSAARPRPVTAKGACYITQQSCFDQFCVRL